VNVARSGLNTPQNEDAYLVVEADGVLNPAS